jgi:hypothetical protein
VNGYELEILHPLFDLQQILRNRRFVREQIDDVNRRPETNPRDRALGYMMPDFTIALAIGLVIGFILGYGVRAIISYRRHRHARRQSYRF